jgi:succinate dehydrogenase/fumarate reductase cytochrome b subunit
MAGQRARAGLHSSHRPRHKLPVKIIVLVFIFLILASLASALYYLVKDKGTSHRTARALTWRVVFSIALFVILMLGFQFGFITTKL